MKCSIMQPTYFPWPGYFNLIEQSSVFVFLDDVQFEKGSWQNRNRILLQGKSHWITVPVFRKSHSQTIEVSEIDFHFNWRDKHSKLINQVYSNYPFGKEVIEAVKVINDPAMTYLADLNIKIIRSFCQKLGLERRFFRSSELKIEGDRTERLIRICEMFNCDEYLSPVGSADYLFNDGFENRTKIRLIFQDYQPHPYPQFKSSKFVDHLSILDVLANLGWQDALQYIKEGKFIKSQEMLWKKKNIN